VLSCSVSRPAVRGGVLAVEFAAVLCNLWPSRVPGFLQDRRDIRIGDEVLPALRVPVEEHPHPALLIGIAEAMRTLRTVLLSLLEACGREDTPPAVEILDLGRCENNFASSVALGAASRCRWYSGSMAPTRAGAWGTPFRCAREGGALNRTPIPTVGSATRPRLGHPRRRVEVIRPPTGRWRAYRPRALLSPRSAYEEDPQPANRPG
jgi:hypothetical protein